MRYLGNGDYPEGFSIGAEDPKTGLVLVIGPGGIKKTVRPEQVTQTITDLIAFPAPSMWVNYEKEAKPLDKPSASSAVEELIQKAGQAMARAEDSKQALSKMRYEKAALDADRMRLLKLKLKTTRPDPKKIVSEDLAKIESQIREKGVLIDQEAERLQAASKEHLKKRQEVLQTYRVKQGYPPEQQRVPQDVTVRAMEEGVSKAQEAIVQAQRSVADLANPLGAGK